MYGRMKGNIVLPRANSLSVPTAHCKDFPVRSDGDGGVSWILRLVRDNTFG